MTKDEILKRISSPELPIPRPRDVGAYYAAWLATVYECLTPEQQAQAITLGGLVHYRSSYMIPVMGSVGADGLISDFELAEGRPLQSNRAAA